MWEEERKGGETGREQTRGMRKVRLKKIRKGGESGKGVRGGRNQEKGGGKHLAWHPFNCVTSDEGRTCAWKGGRKENNLRA